MHSDRKDIANFVPGKGFLIQGNGSALYFLQTRTTLPRASALLIKANQKGDLVVRGGMGVFFDQINLNPFLDFRPPVTAAQGIEGNPFGPSSVTTYSTEFCGATSYNWDSVQVPGRVCPVGTPNADRLTALARFSEMQCLYRPKLWRGYRPPNR